MSFAIRLQRTVQMRTVQMLNRHAAMDIMNILFGLNRNIYRLHRILTMNVKYVLI